MVGQIHLPVLNTKMLDKNQTFLFNWEGRYQAQNKGKSPGTINKEKK